MHQSAALLPAAIGAALAECALLPLPPALRAALAELLRCVSATDPARPFRASVAHLMARMSRSRNTVSRYLAALVAAGLLERWQSTRGARRWGFRCAQMRLTPRALDLLGLQRAPSVQHVPNPVSQGNRWTRVRRIPQDLAALADKIGAARVVWLMACCRAAGRRLQEFAAGALAADSPAGYVLHALRGRPGSARAPEPPSPGSAAASGGGDSRQDAREYLDAQQKAGVRTAAGRLAGLAMLRAIRRQ
jgi:hypothetical protein